MLSQENNERLTRVGPGTPMGRLMREYWIPALLSSELPSPDCAPVRVMLLCERLIAFRDTLGRVGLFAEACPHRGASLFFGRNEECGLRCAYHGWKFNVNGECVETPTEPEDSPLRRNIRIKAYPCVERGGVVWAYLGSRSAPPPLPELEANLPETCGEVGATIVENNWLQCIEGDIDLVHIPFLHADNRAAFAEARAEQRPPEAVTIDRTPPLIQVSDTAAGFAFAGSRQPWAGTAGSAGSRQSEWAVGHFMFPFYANLPYGPLSCQWVVARVPMDDYHTLTFGMWTRTAAVPPRDLRYGDEPHYLPRTPDWFGRFRLARNVANDFKIDRERARTMGMGTGIRGQVAQDAAITASMGPIADRRHEHLGKGDVAIIHLRKRLLAALAALDSGIGAPAVDNPSAYRVMHGNLTVPENACWHEELRRVGGAGRS